MAILGTIISYDGINIGVHFDIANVYLEKKWYV